MTIQLLYREDPWSRQSATEKPQRVNNRRAALNAKTPGKCRLGRSINVKVSTLEPALLQTEVLLNRLLIGRTNIPFNDNPIALQRGFVVKIINTRKSYSE